MVDAMAIQKNVTWDSSKQKFIGYVDIGNGQCSDQQASEVLVILINSILDKWKQPLAYFLTKGMSGGSLAQILRDTIELMESINIRIVTITCDGDAKNQAALKILGLQPRLRKGVIDHPSNNNWKIYVFYDACHMLKLIRNTFKHCAMR